MKINQDHYTYKVTWSEEDQEYIGLCLEFPSLSWLASSPELALKKIRELVSEIVLGMVSNDEDIPVPFAAKTYSGKFLVRIPPNLHRKLAMEAAEAGISLNRLASEKLSGGQ